MATENANKNEQPQEEVNVEQNNNKKSTVKKVLIWTGGIIVAGLAAFGIYKGVKNRRAKRAE